VAKVTVAAAAAAAIVLLNRFADPNVVAVLLRGCKFEFIFGEIDSRENVFIVFIKVSHEIFVLT
jgi:hypothetical protein